MDDLMQRICLNAVAEEATKKAAKREAAKAGAEKVLGPPKPAPQPPGDVFSDLEAQIQAIDHAHASREAEARRAYLDLLARMAPPRTGPAPPTDAHALAVRPEGGAPPSLEILTILRAVRKTPEELRNDVRTLTSLRDDADRVATLPELHDAERAADLALDEEKEAFEQVQAEWAIKIEVKKRLLDQARSERQRADGCVYRLEKYQDVAADLRLLRTPLIADRAKAPPERLAEEQRVNEAQDALHASARRLGLLERVFFPPLAEPSSAVRHEGWSAEYAPRDDAR